MSRKSSIHFQPVSNVRFAVSHSERTDLSEPAYLLPKEHQLDNILVAGSLSENELSALFIQQKEGMSRQAKTAGASPFWEGVLVLPNTDGKEQSKNLQGWKKEYEKATGHKVLHISVHLDEGYLDQEGKPQYNPHAHVIVSRMDSKNRVINLDRKQLAAVQDLTAQTLKMERGSTLAERLGKRGRAHVPHREFRAQADEKRLGLERPKADLERLQKLSKKWSDADLEKIKKLQSKLEEEPARLAAALAQQEAQLKARYQLDIEALETKYKADREAYKASTEKKTQQDYKDLKAVHLSELDALAKSHASDLADLQTKLATAQSKAAQVPDLVAQVNTLKPKADRVPDLEKDLAEAQAEIDQLATTLQTKLDREPERLEAALAAQKLQLDEQYRLDRETLKASGEATQQDYQALKTAHEADLVKLATAQQELVAATAKVTAQASEITQLNTQAATTAQQVPELERQLKASKEQADKVPELETKLATALAKAAQVPDLVAQVKASVEATQQLKKDHEADLAKVKTELASAVETAQQQAGEIDRLNTNLAGAQDSYATLREKALGIQDQRNALAEKVKNMTQENQDLRSENERLEAVARITLKTLSVDFGVDIRPAEKLQGTALHEWTQAAEDRVMAQLLAEREADRAAGTPAPRPIEAARKAPDAPKLHQAPTPLPSPEKTLGEALLASLAAMLDWIKAKGGVLVDLDTQQSDHYGPVVQLDNLHAVQSTGRGKHVVHKLAQLDRVPALDDNKTEVHYRGGVGQVKGQSLGRGGRAG